ncbi:Tn7 transposase TnsA N-terminal domain-containing protein [Thiolapillus sp.]|uniref:Tn7 transposase TnsA N-terminal domain-containing protein n=2 Tax=Thiolapillus sp. TaxID=2017437 RepID=UPI003AF58E01
MSVRKIPRNYRVITGCVASEKSANNAAEFEGSLERDLYHLLDFDWTVERFEEQPVEIRYKDARGKTRKYTPDVLIEYVPEVDRKPVLAEVKFRKELKEHWRDFKPRFRAALRFAKENGWVFRKRVFDLVIDFGTSQSPKSTRPLTTYWCPSRPGHPALRNNFASSLLLRTWLPMTGRRVRRPTLFSLWRKARRENSAASRLLGSTSLRFALHGWQRR